MNRRRLLRCRLLVLAVVCAWPASVTAQDYAEKLAALSGVRGREQASTAQRYRFVLPRIAEACVDLQGASDAADLVFVTHGLIDDAGLHEPLQELAETLHSLIMEAAAAARRADLPVKCREVFTLYVSARFNGARPAAAHETVGVAVGGVYGLATEARPAEPAARPAAAKAPAPEPAKAPEPAAQPAQAKAPDPAPERSEQGGPLACLPDCRNVDLSGADLTGANLSGARLFKADLRNADLAGANLYANLRGATLGGAVLYEADLRGADLIGAVLPYAVLVRADLAGAKLAEVRMVGANLSGADLREAYLTGAALYGANLIAANLAGADLRGADLRNANLSEADLTGATLPNGDAGALGCDKGERLPGCSTAAEAEASPDLAIGWKGVFFVAMMAAGIGVVLLRRRKAADPHAPGGGGL